MLITKVCEKEGCSGNRFRVNTEDKRLQIKCTECGTVYDYQEELSYIVAPGCVKCDHEEFKVNRDNKTGGLYLNCVQCNNPPRKIYTDKSGNQISYDQIVLVDIKSSIDDLAERFDVLAEGLEGLKTDSDY